MVKNRVPNVNYATISPFLAWPIFVYGMLFGSFANVVSYRIPRKESIVFPASHCPHCQHRIRPFELIPVVSWLFLCGKCRACKQNISIQYPVIELSIGVLWLLSLHQANSWSQLFVWILFWFFLLVTVGTDFTAMIVPDILSLPAAFLFALGVMLTQIQSVSMAVLGMGIGYGMIYLIHRLSAGKMGLGDAKLYLSIGALLGPWLTIESFILACLFGSVLGLVLRLTGKLKKGQSIPFVPYIALGTVVTAFFGHEILHFYLLHVLQTT
jgi:prepilin signal peptidase PulO-like enzyme (type II secretory pathway)